MRVKLLTLRFSPAFGGFDDAPLREAIADRDVLSFREHFFVVGDVPHLLCVIAVAGVPRAAPGGAGARPGEEGALQRSSGVGATNGAPPPGGPGGPGGAGTAHDLLAALDPAQRRLFDTLRGWRSRTAHHEGVPPYVVLTNRQLVELVRARPTCTAGLQKVDGFGDKKTARYGKAILAALGDAAAATVPKVATAAPEATAATEAMAAIEATEAATA